MSENTATHDVATVGSWATADRVARELGLKPGEFDLAVDLGRIRVTSGEPGTGRRVDRGELRRLRARPGRPRALRESVRTVGTTEGALLMGVTKDRFTCLARLGLLVPTRFCLNRHRAVVWLCPAEELRQFTADEKNTVLLRGRTPDHLRGQLDTGLDLRARNRRTRRAAVLLRRATDPWSRAGALASLLAPPHVAEVVRDPYERSHLSRFCPGRPSRGAPGSPAAVLAETLVTAQDPDEIAWLQADLAQLLAQAREHRPAPRPAPVPHRPAPAGPHRRGRCPGSRSAHAGCSAALPARRRGRKRGPGARRLLPGGSGGGCPPPRRPAGRGDPPAIYSARNSPSWTTDTSIRPSRS
ncbi:DUF6397 family protein [Streptomyces sp. NEAU-W12]|uniref:DUF6397 family protein n=1 Tax=Streptomyces sp. NEAU-W12 TaxID=2994668 RepID=UPI00224AF4B4|nr:DUF6397 family protein [Streptomyces sp. NEAU-W12]MCX2924788.1 DUF6397 family protein [Streptomyces sp. NEAU-W12]